MVHVDFQDLTLALFSSIYHNTHIKLFVPTTLNSWNYLDIHGHSPLYLESESESEVVSDSLRPYGLLPIRLLRPWDFPGKSTGVDCHFLLQGIFPTQESNAGLLHCRQILSQLSYKGSPNSQSYHSPKDINYIHTIAPCGFHKTAWPKTSCNPFKPLIIPHSQN